MANTLRKEIGDWLNWQLGEYTEARRLLDESDLADRLERNGYCTEPYTEYNKALTCPLNKRRERFCGNILCHSYNFCLMLRKEGYIYDH